MKKLSQDLRQRHFSSSAELDLVTSDSSSSTSTSSSNSRSPSPTSSPSSSSPLPLSPSSPILSSGVLFQPPSSKYWKIGRNYYDFAPFLKRHPGGAEVLLLARDRFNDATYAFEAHHMDQPRVRKIIEKYRVKGLAVPASSLEDSPKLLPDDSFYSILRSRVNQYFKENKMTVGPTRLCLVTFWSIFFLWIASVANTLRAQTIWAAVLQGFAASLLGAFGHNWVHQPGYMWAARLSLDTIGFSSQGWYREHVLQHHMYTNTPLDNHFHGTDPFLNSDPTVPRNFFNKLCAILNPIVLCFALPGNYIIHLVEMFHGRETWTLGKTFFPAIVGLFVHICGWRRGLWLMFVQGATLGNHYFTMALMNHNSDHCQDVKSRNKAKDWGIAQLHSCADWGTGRPFLASAPFLWLNYHTVHHMFPLTDFSHHPAIQKIMIATCREFDVEYETGNFFTIYKEMIGTFMHPTSLAMEVNCYASYL